MKTRGSDKSAAGKGAVAEGLAVVMEIVDDVVEELGREAEERGVGLRRGRGSRGAAGFEGVPVCMWTASERTGRVTRARTPNCRGRQRERDTHQSMGGT